METKKDWGLKVENNQGLRIENWGLPQSCQGSGRKSIQEGRLEQIHHTGREAWKKVNFPQQQKTIQNA